MTPQARKPKATPTIKVEIREIDTLLMDPNNARVHSVRNIEAIQASLRRHGQQKPIVIDQHNVVIAGNGTLAAAKAEGWEVIECKVFGGDSAQAMAYALEDNRTAELATWDLDILTEQFNALPDSIVGDLGWTADELEKILAPMNGDPIDSGATGTYKERWEVVVECEDEADQEKAYEELTAKGFKCRTVTL